MAQAENKKPSRNLRAGTQLGNNSRYIFTLLTFFFLSFALSWFAGLLLILPLLLSRLTRLLSLFAFLFLPALLRAAFVPFTITHVYSIFRTAYGLWCGSRDWSCLPVY